jgi:hypothetical protein
MKITANCVVCSMSRAAEVKTEQKQAVRRCRTLASRRPIQATAILGKGESGWRQGGRSSPPVWSGNHQHRGSLQYERRASRP